MLRKRIGDNDVTVYESPLLAGVGVPHGFSTRLGGVSEGPFESMNLGNPAGQAVQDSAERISENYRRLHRAIGCEGRRRIFAHQVHGARVLDPAVSHATDSIHGGTEIGKGDALVTGDPTLLLSVRTADCVPVLLADRNGRRVAAVHAGWRGVVAQAVPAALEQFDDPANIIAAIGPAIGFEQFEVGPEVVVAFEAVPLFRSHRGDLVRDHAAGKARIDLRRAIVLQLIASGVPEAAIDSTDRCTVTHADEFFSHRRSGGLTGRMAAVIGARA